MNEHSGSAAELPLHLDRASGIPLPAQLAATLRDAIDRGALRPGEPVTPTRTLAHRLGVARGVVVAAYEQLVAEGYLSAAHGRGTRVDPGLGQLHPAAGSRPSVAPQTGTRDAGTASTRSEGVRSDAEAARPGPLAPGRPDTTAVDTPAWRAAWRRSVSRAHLDAPDLGDPELRSQIAEHLRRMRGTSRPASDIIVTSGTREGLSLLLTALGSTRGRQLTVGVEDPGYPSLRRVAARHGASIVALPVDAQGLDTAALPDGLLDLVIVTPSHQYPLGGSLPLSRRRELRDWAGRNGVVIVEDDYDSELRHSGTPLPTLAALDDPVDGHVVLLGTFSKTVSHALSAGFLLAPAGLRALVEPVRRDLGGSVPAVVQGALAAYLRGGELRRHTARMRRRYAARRALVMERLDGLPGVRIRPMSGGLHAVVQLIGPDASAAEARVSDASDAAGLGAIALSGYWQHRGPGAELFGLVIGAGGAAGTEEFDIALGRLRAILAAELFPEPLPDALPGASPDAVPE